MPAYSSPPGAAEFQRRSACGAEGRTRRLLPPLLSGWFTVVFLLLAGVPAGPRIEPGEPGSLVGDVHNLGLADGGFLMTTNADFHAAVLALGG